MERSTGYRYADDVIVYISDPAKSIPNLMKCLDTFGLYSGYKINVNKTEAFPMNNFMSPQLKSPSSNDGVVIRWYKWMAQYGNML